MSKGWVWRIAILNTTSEPQKLAKKNKSVSLRTFALYPILIPLLYFALRKAPLADIWAAVNHLRLWQITVLVIINITMYFLVTLRWWVIVRAGNKTIPYFPLILVRIAVFGISYFTLGPQVGGEPLQVFYLQRKYGMSYTRATSTVIMDKLLEFLGNFFLLVIGLTAIIQAGPNFCRITFGRACFCPPRTGICSSAATAPNQRAT